MASSLAGGHACQAHRTRTKASALKTYSLVRNHSFDLRRICVAHQDRLAQLSFTFVGLGSQDMAQMGMAALHLSAGSFLKALGGAFVRFHLRHKFLGGNRALSI